MIARFTSNRLVLILSTVATSATAQAIAQVAQDAAASPNVIVAEPNPLDALLISLGGEAGLAALGGAGAVVQALLKVAAASGALDRVPGIAKLGLVTALTLLLGPAALVTVGGVGAGTALIHSTTLAAVMVFLNQVGQQTKKEMPLRKGKIQMRQEPPT